MESSAITNKYSEQSNDTILRLPIILPKPVSGAFSVLLSTKVLCHYQKH
jgi:hypothetical protein